MNLMRVFKGNSFFGLSLVFVFACKSVIAQTSDDQFKLPLKQVLGEIQTRYGVAIRYPEELVKDKWVT